MSSPFLKTSPIAAPSPRALGSTSPQPTTAATPARTAAIPHPVPGDPPSPKAAAATTPTASIAVAVSPAPAAAAGTDAAVATTAASPAATITSDVAAPPPTTSQIRAAFEAKDAGTSRALHQARTSAAAVGNGKGGGDDTEALTVKGAVEKHGGAGSDFIKSIVFGGLDGIITTFSIVAAVAGASLPVEVVLMMGFANLIADGISMGAGDFISSKAELDFVKSERDREAWEMKNYMEGEVEEMVELYKERGVEEEDARSILSTMAKYPDMFLDHMMVMELGLMSPDPSDSPAKEGLVTFVSFLVFGSVPMWVYVILWGAKYSNRNGIFGVACAATAITMFLLGMLQGRITRQNVWKSGLLLMFNGSLAAAAAYLVGWGLEQAIGRGSSC